MTVAVPLSNGGSTTVDDDDHLLVVAHVWHVDTAGYARAMVKTEQGWRLVRMHRLLTAAPVGVQVDHANGNKLDNTRTNLRLCTSRQNIANQPKRSGGSSQFKGVTWHSRAHKWMAQIKLDGKNRYLGLFEQEEEAGHVYAVAARAFYGQFARTA